MCGMRFACNMHTMCLWHACSILVYVIYVAYVMQVSVACVQLECFLCGPCIHCVCIRCMCIELVAFLHVVQYACGFMNVCTAVLKNVLPSSKATQAELVRCCHVLLWRGRDELCPS
jgi:hypothetical protein